MDFQVLAVLSLTALISCAAQNTGSNPQGQGRFFGALPFGLGGIGSLVGFRPGGLFGGGYHGGFGGFNQGGYYPGYRPGGFFQGGYPGGFYGGYPQYPRPGFGGGYPGINRPFGGGGIAGAPSANRPGSDNNRPNSISSNRPNPPPTATPTNPSNNRPIAIPNLSNLTPSQAASLGQALGASLRPLLNGANGAGSAANANQLATILGQLG